MTSLRPSSSDFPGAFRLEGLVVLLVLVFGLTPPPSALAAGAWAPTGSMHTARERHTATLLANGKVLVVGGYDGSNLVASAEVYDPGTSSWTVFPATARLYHTATPLNSGKVLIVGGGGKSVEVYDPATVVWSFTSSLNTGRKDQTTTLLANGLVLVAGGLGWISRSKSIPEQR
jgi:hypothetical protein